MLTLDKIYHAAFVLKDVARKTDLIEAPKLSKDCQLYLKTENLQATGSFKVRGAYYKISQLSPEESAKGVIACSAGNHAQGVALAIELFTDGSLNTFAKPTNVDTNARILCYDIRDLGKQLLPVGMLVVLDSIFNRIIRNRGLKRNTWIYIDEIYLLFQHEYSANFLFTLWKRMRKYQACGTGISQNIEDLLQSHTARTMLANSEFLIMLNQAATDREELAHLLNISDNQLSYITNVDSGRGLIKCGSAIVPFVDSFPRHTRLYQMMTTRPSDLAA